MGGGRRSPSALLVFAHGCTGWVGGFMFGSVFHVFGARAARAALCSARGCVGVVL